MRSFHEIKKTKSILILSLIQSNRIASSSVLNDNLENPLSSTLVDPQMKNLVKTGLELLPRVLETSNLVTPINDSGIILEKSIGVIETDEVITEPVMANHFSL